jgi:hypothetical protein
MSLELPVTVECPALHVVDGLVSIGQQAWMSWGAASVLQ